LLVDEEEFEAKYEVGWTAINFCVSHITQVQLSSSARRGSQVPGPGALVEQAYAKPKGEQARYGKRIRIPMRCEGELDLEKFTRRIESKT